MASKTTLEIAAGDWRAAVRPGAGGVLAALSHRDHDVLRPMPPEADQPVDAACFPMVPYCNRIRRGQFTFGGRSVRLPLNLPPERHSLHGLGWQRPWLVTEIVGATIELVLDHAGAADGSGWPWPFRAVQRFELDESGLTQTLTLINPGTEVMPAGMGLHPFFRRWKDSRARFAARDLVLTGIDQLPTGELVPADHFGDWSKGQTVPRHTIDHCHTDWSGEVRIEDGLGAITMTVTGASNLHVYAPGTGRELAFEPVNHLPDALNRDGRDWTMPVLAPGQQASVVMRIAEG